MARTVIYKHFQYVKVYLIQNSQAVKKECNPQNKKAMVKKDVKSKVAAK